jgi:tetrameric-type glycyl-tRNA synthetase beta subunit
MSHHYLLEIGAEELPAGFILDAVPELKQKTEEALKEAKLSFQSVTVQYTPRRLALSIQGLATQQESYETVLKGPPVSVGIAPDGSFSAAALGFAKKINQAAEALVTEAIDHTEYLVFHQKAGGKACTDILPLILPQVVLSLSGSHFMCWDSSGIRFSRPIRWLLSLLDNDHLPLGIGLCHSSRVSYGHRFFAQESPVQIRSASSYEETLLKQGVVWVNAAQREKQIVRESQNLAATVGGKAVMDPELLKIVASLVETPHPIIGYFDPSYLRLPRPVIETVMTTHQKYFPVESASGQLCPNFITVSNNPNPKAVSEIQRGNEKVLKARLEDAVFFYDADITTGLSHYATTLSGVTFQRGLGSLADKTQRLSVLGPKIAIMQNLSEDQKQDILRASQLLKADLASHLVRELTELQGVVGHYYALQQGESDAVALAIQEHYLPRFLGDAVAQSPVGIVVSLADKLDTLMAVFAQKDARMPTGSKDPMGLRRMALGIILTLSAHALNLNLNTALAEAYEGLGTLAQSSHEESLAKAKDFILQRLKGFLLDQGYVYDTIDAVFLSSTDPLDDLALTLKKLALLKTLQAQPTFPQIYEPANRTAKILAASLSERVFESTITSSLLIHASEKALYDALQKTEFSLEAFEEAAFILSPLVAQFYEDVLVNDPQPEIKQNRIALLKHLNGFYTQLAQWTRIVV